MNGWILIKFAEINCLETDKNCLDFGDLDLFSRSYEILVMSENGLSGPYFLNELIDFDQPCHRYIVGTWSIANRILVTLTSFSRSKNVEKWLFCIISPEEIDG